MITAEMEIEDLVNQYPEVVGLLMQKGIVCIQCGTPIWGTLKEAAERKGITDVDGLVDELNDWLKKGKKQIRKGEMDR
jgi:hybrid cluster-associated redox disulfide protein